ncbi:MAG: hypothetical protein II699_05405, partial [Lachnospiraceae bacterium]|nr:hypothetical protein [Lachnospiraceae bacterium]
GKCLFDLGGGAVMGLEICEDLWAPIPPSSEMSICGANIICNLSASDEYVSKAQYREDLITNQSARCICAYAYSGASVGGINAALFAAGGVPLSDTMWDMINESLLSVKDIVTPDLSNDIELELMIRKSGVLDELDVDAPIASVTAFDEVSGYPKDAILNSKSKDDKLKWIMATAAFPIAFEKQIVDGSTLVDGGIPVFGNNVPISPLYYMGVRKSIVVHLSSKNEARSKVSLDLFNNKANEEEYFTGLKCLHIYPSEDLGNTFDGTMNFTREYLDHIEDLGFSDGVKALSSLDVLDEELEADTELHYVDGVRYDSYVQVLKNL